MPLGRRVAKKIETVSFIRFGTIYKKGENINHDKTHLFNILALK